MTERLKAICSLIDKTESFIDVGCDHGYAVKYVCDNKLAERITACDISKPSLDKAEKLIGQNAGVKFVCADGAKAAGGYETVLISGMGGSEIISIMNGCEPITFILSPQSHVCEVRRDLLRRDYRIQYDKTVKSGGKYYDVIKAVKGGGAQMLGSASELNLKYGMFLHESNPALKEKLEKMLKAFSAYPQNEENALTVQELKEAIKCQLR